MIQSKFHSNGPNKSSQALQPCIRTSHSSYMTGVTFGTRGFSSRSGFRGVEAHKVKARVQNGGIQVNVFTKMPCELINKEAHRLTYQDEYGRPYFSKTDIRIVSHTNEVAKLKVEANDEEIWTVMKINLPFQVEERFFSDGSITGYHLARVNDKLMMFLELIGVRFNFKA